MCGITAIINTNDNDESLINSMLFKIKHRGDTQPNYEKMGNNFIGNVRLKIVDIDNGKQPFYNEDKSIGVVFNGEIYNYKELRTDLIEKGYKFNTDCDTEVLPYLYEEYGVKFLSMLDGMFAFVLIDLKSNSHFFARDRVGIKPLYYCLKTETIFVSSELKSFEKIDTAVYKELLPACYYYNGEIKKYNILNYDIDYSITFNEAVESIKSLLVSAVKKRVQTDLPIGIFLSGGIDSSVVFYLALQFHKNIIPIIVGKENSEDFIAASKLCNYFGVEYVHINPSEQEILDTIPEIVECIETFEPNPVRGSAVTY
ncbi:MAG: asparagine synthetase B, partial [Chitinophagaceae bacterium]|nr:asparagine synthetase B [Chitinophagaceae bacterium]